MPSRRSYLCACAAAGVAGFAGCIDDSAATPATATSDGAATGGSGETPTATPGETAWRRSLPGAVENRPALAEDRLFAGSDDGTVTALSRDDGRVEWEFETGAAVQGTPVVAGDTLLVVSGGVGLGEHHTVYALDAATGDERWTFAPEEWWLDVLGTDDGTAFVATTDDYLQSSGQRLYALSVTDGSTQWSVEVGDNRGGLVTDERVYVPSAGALDAVSRDGTRDWSVEYGRYRFKTLTAAGDTVAYVTADDPSEPTVHGVDAATGDERWTYEQDRAYTTRAVDGALFVGGETVARLDPATGESRWVADHQAALYDVPVADGTLYTAGRTAAAIDVEGGRVAWDRSLDAYAARPVGIAGGALLVHKSAGEDDRNRHLLAIDASGGERRWEFAGESELTRPVVGSGRTYVCEGSDVVAVATETGSTGRE